MFSKCKCACCGKDLFLDVEITETIRIEKEAVSTEIKHVKVVDVYSYQHILEHVTKCIGCTENLNNDIENIIYHISVAFGIDINSSSYILGCILENADNGMCIK